MAAYDIGVSASTSSGAQSGIAQTGDFNVTGGGGGGALATLLPKLPAEKAWIVYVVIGVVAVIIAALFFKFRK